MKKKVGDESRVDGLLFFGLVGFTTLIVMGPLLFGLDLSGIEKFEMPTKELAQKLLLNASFAFV
jgi:solute carrier family 35 protein F5